MNKPLSNAGPLGELILPWSFSVPQPGKINGHYAGKADASSVFLNSGEAWFPPSPKVLEAIGRTLGKIHYYPDNHCCELRERVAAYVGNGVSSANVIIGNGSDGLLDLIAKVVIAPGQNVIAPAPTFWVYSHTATIRGANVITMGRRSQKEAFRLNPQEVISSITPETRVIFLASPNNPTGDAVSIDDIKFILDNSSCLVVVDECYYEFSGESAVSLLKTHPRLLVLRSFSKSFALAGLRAGYAIASEPIIQAMERVDQTFTVNVLAQTAAIAALADHDYYRKKFAETTIHRETMTQRLTSIGLSVFPSRANILLVDYGSKYSGNLSQELSQKGVYVADFHDKGPIRNSFRSSVTNEVEQDKLLAALQQLIDRK